MSFYNIYIHRWFLVGFFFSECCFNGNLCLVDKCFSSKNLLNSLSGAVVIQGEVLNNGGGVEAVVVTVIPSVAIGVGNYGGGSAVFAVVVTVLIVLNCRECSRGLVMAMTVDVEWYSDCPVFVIEVVLLVG